MPFHPPFPRQPLNQAEPVMHRDDVGFPIFAAMCDRFAHSARLKADEMVGDFNKFGSEHWGHFEPFSGFNSDEKGP
jgi:hypothetical protein